MGGTMRLLPRTPWSTWLRDARAWAALIPLLVALALPGVHWPLYGWAKGEAFYQNRPTSYWASEVCSYELAWMYDVIGNVPADWSPPTPPLIAMSISRRDPLARLKFWRHDPPLVVRRSEKWYWSGGEAPPSASDPAALAVLAEMLRRPEARWWAVSQ